MKTSEILEEHKFEMLNFALELNEHKKENKYVPVEAYEQLLEMYLNMIDVFRDSEESGEKYRDSISDILGLKK